MVAPRWQKPNDHDWGEGEKHMYAWCQLDDAISLIRIGDEKFYSVKSELPSPEDEKIQGHLDELEKLLCERAEAMGDPFEDDGEEK